MSIGFLAPSAGSVYKASQSAGSVYKAGQYALAGRRVCTACEMSAPLCALVASVIALSIALYMHSYYFCIPFGLGILGSAYALYKAYRARDLASLSQSVSALEQNVAHLEEVKASLTQTTQNLSAECTRLQETNTQLEETAANLKDLLSKSEEQCREFSKQVSNLQEVNTSITKELTSAKADRDQHRRDLEQAKAQLTSMEAQFQQTLRDFQTNLTSLQAIVPSTKNLGLATELNTCLVESLSKCLNECSTLARQLSGKTLEEILKTHQLAQKSLMEQQVLLQETRTTHTALKSEISSLAQQSEQLKQQNIRLQNTSQELSDQVERMRALLNQHCAQYTTNNAANNANNRFPAS